MINDKLLVNLENIIPVTLHTIPITIYQKTCYGPLALRFLY